MKFSLELVNVQVIILSFMVERMKYNSLLFFKILLMYEFYNIISKVSSNFHRLKMS